MSQQRKKADDQKAKPAAQKTAKVETEDGKQQLNALRWLEREKIPGFIEWKKIEHPDFPNQTVEVGGFHPLVLLSPPAKELDGIAEKHAKFVEWLAGLLPKLEVRNVKIDSLGKGIYRIRLLVINSGYLATSSEMGRTTDQVPPLVWEWSMPDGTEWVQGTRRGFIDRLPGMNGQAEKEWLVRLPDEKAATVKLQIGAPAPVA